MSIIGRTIRLIPRAVKLDECPSCQTVATHALARRVRWIHVFSLPLLRLRSDQVLVCGNCGHATPIENQAAFLALKYRTLELERERPLLEAGLAARTGAVIEPELPPTSSPRSDPAVVRASAERRIQQVVPIRVSSPQALYYRAWPALAAVFVLALVGGGAFATMDVAGVSLTSLQTNSALANVSPAPSQTPTPTPAPTERLPEAAFAWWKQAYVDHVQPCYAGGTCDPNWLVEYDDGTSAPLAAEAVRLSELYRDNDSVEVGSVTDCRQEHGSMYPLVASMASEMEVIQALKPGESMPARNVVLSVNSEPCTAPLPDSQTSAEHLRDAVTVARAELVKVGKLLRAKDWSEARKASPLLAQLAVDVMRRSARDFPSGSDSSWAPVRGAGWDLMRVSALIEVERLAGKKSTSKLISDTIKEIDGINLSGS